MQRSLPLAIPLFVLAFCICDFFRRDFWENKLIYFFQSKQKEYIGHNYWKDPVKNLILSEMISRKKINFISLGTDTTKTLMLVRNYWSVLKQVVILSVESTFPFK